MQAADNLAEKTAKIDMLFLRHGGPSKLHHLREGLMDALGLPDDRLQRLAASRILVAEQQILGLPGNDGQRVVNFVPGAGGQFDQATEF